MGLAAKLYRDERAADRQAVALDATLRKPDQQPVDILIEDLSVTGFRMAGAARLALDAIVTVGISGVGRREARVVRQSDDHYGCEFLMPIAPAEIARAQTVDTIVHADFGAIAEVAGEPGLDAGELLIRRFRGLILTAGAVLPWVAIGAGAHALWG